MSASVDSVTGDLYVGDAAGIYIPETGDMRAATANAGLRPAGGAFLESLRTFAAASADATAVQPFPDP